MPTTLKPTPFDDWKIPDTKSFVKEVVYQKAMIENWTKH